MYKRPTTKRCLPLLLAVFLYSGTVFPVYAQAPVAAEATDRSALLERYVEQLAPLGFDYSQVGSVLEGLGALHLQNIYTNDGYEVYGDVQYTDATDRILGELDLVVWYAPGNEVVAIYEAKVSKRYRRAANEARKQIRRFREAISNNTIAAFESRIQPSRKWQVADFTNCTTFGIIGGRGIKRHGGTFEIDLTRDEADTVQKALRARGY
jgi:hypothetical protein